MNVCYGFGEANSGSSPAPQASLLNQSHDGIHMSSRRSNYELGPTHEDFTLALV